MGTSRLCAAHRAEWLMLFLFQGCIRAVDFQPAAHGAERQDHECGLGRVPAVELGLHMAEYPDLVRPFNLSLSLTVCATTTID